MSNERARFEVSGLERNRRVWVSRTALATSLIAVLISLCVLVYVTVVFTRDRQARNQPAITEDQPVRYPELCMDCLKLTKNHDQSEPDPILESMTKITMNGVLKCCVENPAQLSALLEEMLREKFALPGELRVNSEQGTKPDELHLDSEHMTIPVHGQQTFPPGLQFAPVSVKKRLTYGPAGGIISGTSDETMLGFEPGHNDPLTEHVRGVTVLEDGLFIQHTGLYFVYFSISYRQDLFRHGRQGDNQSICSSVRLIKPTSAESDIVLLKFCPERCHQCKETMEPIVPGGTFSLLAGDFIQFYQSGKDHISFDEFTYFGLAKLAD